MKKTIWGLSLVLAMPFASLIKAGTTNDIPAGTRSYVLESDPIAKTTVMVLAGSEGCTGSLITSDIIITAAHCIKASVKDIKIIFGTDITQYDLDKIRKAAAVKINPDYQNWKDRDVDRHDIALIKIKGALPPGYHPAELLTSAENDSVKEGQVTLVAGYGGNSWGFLSKIELSVAKKLGESEILLDQSNGQGARHGDSGGPAFTANGKLWGICSRGYTDILSEKSSGPFPYSVYTQAFSYSSWIKDAQIEMSKADSN